MPLQRVCSARAYPRRAPTCAQHGKSTLGPQGRFAPLRGGRRPSLTADRRLAPGKAGRDGGMVHSIKQRDGRITGVGPPNRQPNPLEFQKRPSGLGSAFFYAGTRALLVTNWSIHSASARELTSDLFRRQSDDASLSRSEALRQ